MKALPILAGLITFLHFTSCQAQIPNEDVQIATAVQAAPEDKRAGAAVYGYTAAGDIVKLREGDNEFVCLADNPNRDGFSAACYHKELDPFMAGGRELRAEGKSRSEVFGIREKEAKSGKLKMPDHPSTLYVLSGSNGKYDPETGEVTGANLRYVVYIPFATAESTGLPLEPQVPGGPWIMDPGTHKAHIMVTPPAE
jgi:hypothetical protein